MRIFNPPPYGAARNPASPDSFVIPAQVTDTVFAKFTLSKRLEILNLLTLNIKLLITTTHSRQLANFLPVMLQYDHVFVASRKKSNKTAGL